jgi:multidrug transporter EmrE-like cation transporter
MKPSEVNLWTAFLNFISQTMTAYLYLFAAILSEISAAFRLKLTDLRNFYRQPALLGIGFIIAGVLIIHLFSKAAG